ncbi:hypothetical protein [Solimicrobium silvestre]|uniref:Uncharacterized protein n=1 Tax=Solimicrobium silvestre TaxID=2099400 RepID=A0A2S9H099_9BURK|nr:hypothetical protein [Solimicrobium silvestre]PRC93397.1 hypothetical protein S2091_1784 [Solimicrobium silvestre]
MIASRLKKIMAYGFLIAFNLLGPAVVNAEIIPTLHPRWTIQQNGIQTSATDQHTDQLEMSGRQVSTIIDYGRDVNGSLNLRRTLVWPMLRTIPDDTHASLIRKFELADSPSIEIDGHVAPKETLRKIRYDGQLTLDSELMRGLSLTRLLSPATDEPALIERLTLTNHTDTVIAYRFDALNKTETTPAQAGTHGSYLIRAFSRASSGSLKSGQSMHVDVLYQAQLVNEMVYVDVNEQLAARRQKLQSWRSRLVLDTPEPVLNQMFEFAKIRAAESIFATRGGLLHAPGGGRYYAAIWANDQAEYANPFFPYLGDASGVEAALNSFRLFAGYMNPTYQPIPSSIIAEGRGFWNGAGDRGDCAMIAYGAGQFALAQGDAALAEQVHPLINWCLEYTRRQRDAAGIVHSDSDELEGRFESGKANLSTNVLAYASLIGAARLSQDPQERSALNEEAQLQRSAINRYFAANVGGFDTYRYYDGNTKLRAWIALPLVFGMEERKAGTVAALLSPQLWSLNGVLSEAESNTYWDRATLYGFRGLMKVGELEQVMPYFRYYSGMRLTGEHVPYAIEAWPEGNQRQLSAESALYARVIVEGLFGIEPVGLRSFNIAPRLPKAWPHMALTNIRAFGAGFVDGQVSESGLDISTTRIKQQRQHVQVRLHGKLIVDRDWDGHAMINVILPE